MDDSDNNIDGTTDAQPPGGLSWRAMLVILALALVVAAVVAYLLVDPFFHQAAPR